MENNQKQCNFCEKYFTYNKDTDKFCSKSCYQKDYRVRKGLVANFKEKECVECGNKFTPKRKATAQACSIKCHRDYFNRLYARQRTKARLESIDAPPTCVICGYQSTSLAPHIRYEHGMTVDAYKTQYNQTSEDLYHETYREKQSEQFKGEKNPGYKHGGTLSPYSKKFVKYAFLSDEEKEIIISNLVKDRVGFDQAYNTRIEYYLNKGMTQEEAEKALSERQRTFSKEICVAKYGEEKGLEIFEARQIKWTLAVYGQSDEKRKALNKAKLSNSGATSKPAKKLFTEILELFDETERERFWFEDGENVERMVTIDGKHHRLDFYDQETNSVIEFYGDFWHGYPDMDKYPDDKVHKVNYLTYGEIRKRDMERNKRLTDNGYRVKIVWERDFRENKQKVIEECISFLKS